MIQEFNIKNYLSIKDTQTLSFIPRKSNLNDETFTSEVKPGVRLLKSVMIYGANASGKSNILKALDFLRTIVIVTRKRGEKTGFVPFKFNQETIKSPGEFEIIFYQSKYKFRYYLKITEKEIIEEELNYYRSQSPACVFYRKTISEQEISIEYGQGDDYRVNAAEREMIRARVLPNVSVLSTLGEVSTKNDILLRAYNWFLNYLKPLITPEIRLKGSAVDMIFDEENKKIENLLTDLMRKADFNIDRIITDEEYIGTKEDEIKNKEDKLTYSHTLYYFNGNRAMTKVLGFHHNVVEGNETKSYPLEDELESRGTWRYFGLAGTLLEILQANKILIIDELDSSLHPDLLNYFYSMFLVNSRKAQMIFTIHNRELLEDKELCRRDSIWFTEKQRDGSTELYSIADLSGIRKDKSFEKLYKVGKFGATPNLGSLYLDIDYDKD